MNNSCKYVIFWIIAMSLFVKTCGDDNSHRYQGDDACYHRYC